MVLVPCGLAGALYIVDIARIFTMSTKVFSLAACFFMLLLLYVITMLFATFWSFLRLEPHRWTLLLCTILGLLFTAGSFFPVGHFVIRQQDTRFLKRLPEYQRAVDIITRSVQLRENSWQDLGGQFPDLANGLRVETSSGSMLNVYFMAHPRFLKKGLRGYAYNSADQWSESFISTYGHPKKLTNSWYRI